MRTGACLGVGFMGIAAACAEPAGEYDLKAAGEAALGGLQLGLALADGSTVDRVTFTITRASETVVTGEIELQPDGQVSRTIAGLSAGNGYRVVLEAGRDGGPVCVGAADFEVFADQVTVARVVLQCDAADVTGAVNVNASFNVCPRVRSAYATPISAPIGGSIAVGAQAEDRDGDPVLYQWSEGGTVFAAAATASYVCTRRGPAQLTVTAKDPSACERSLSVTVSCDGCVSFTSVTCRNNVIVPISDCCPAGAVCNYGLGWEGAIDCGDGVCAYRLRGESCGPDGGLARDAGTDSDV